MPIRHRLLCPLLCLLLAAAPAIATEPTLRGDAARPAAAAHWQRAELYFGLGDDGASAEVRGNDDVRWRQFLDEVVTPRFPDGFTVLDGYGQWQRRDAATPERLRTKIVVILFQGAKARAALDAIRTEWKQRTGDQSVLLTLTPAAVSF